MFVNEQGLCLADFSPQVLKTTDNFQAVLAAMNETCCEQALPEHFLMALLRFKDSRLARRVAVKVDPGVLASAAAGTVKSSATVVHKQFQPQTLSAAAVGMFRRLGELCDASGDAPEAQEAMLSAAVLESCSPRLAKLLVYSDLDAAAMAKELAAAKHETLKVFAADGAVIEGAMDRGAMKALNCMVSEGQSLGLDVLSTPLLLLALVGDNGGMAGLALRSQQVSPKEVQEAVLLRLRALGVPHRLTQMKLERACMQQTLQEVLQTAGSLAQDDSRPQVGQTQLLAALLDKDPVIAGGMLREHKVDLGQLADFLRRDQSLPATEVSPEEKPLTVEEIVEGLKSKIVGQDHVIEAIQPLLKRLRYNYTRPNKPMGVYLFLGPSGTGKTETAKALARFVYGADDQMVFLEMGQFGSEHDKSIFIGAPPGYVGFGEGQLTNGLRDHPQAVILFDEVEKAHKSVFDVLLRFLDEGVIMDPAGPLRDGRKCLIVLTSNLMLDGAVDLRWEDADASAPGAAPTLKQVYSMDTHTRQATIRNALSKIAFFRPEFVNRVEEIILFKNLSENDFLGIAQRELAAEVTRFGREKEKTVELASGLVEAISQRAMMRSREGARAVGKVVSTDVVAPLIDFFTTGDNERFGKVKIEILDGRTVVTGQQ